MRIGLWKSERWRVAAPPEMAVKDTSHTVVVQVTDSSPKRDVDQRPLSKTESRFDIHSHFPLP